MKLIASKDSFSARMATGEFFDNDVGLSDIVEGDLRDERSGSMTYSTSLR